jgi:hypothetical protein
MMAVISRSAVRAVLAGCCAVGLLALPGAAPGAVAAEPGVSALRAGVDHAWASGDYHGAIDALMVAPAPRLDELMSALAAGPMPGWDRPSKGYGRCYQQYDAFGPGGSCGTGYPRQFVDAMLPMFWGGKWFFTNADGGYLLNRVMPPLSESALARGFNNGRSYQSEKGSVVYAQSHVDGRPTILITYSPPASDMGAAGLQFMAGIRDECRAVESNGLYLCYTLWDGAPRGPLYRIGFFVLDTLHPDG